MMDRDQARRKAEKLMRLSASSNPHEAATALRMAQKLMEQHAIDAAELDVDGHEPITEEWREGRGANAPCYAARLANVIASAFAVRIIWIRSAWTTHKAVFIGPSSRATVAKYAYEVLLRQLERDRRKYLSRVRKPKNRAARGDVFGISWADSLFERIQRFAGNDDAHRVDRYMAHHYPDLVSGTAEARKSKAVGFGDAHAGMAAGSRASLNHGVTGNTQAALEHLRP